MEAFSRAADLENPHNPAHYKTTDFGDEYNGMLLQE